jgi:hypothetical protein
MEPELHIRDSYQWYEDVFTLPIDEASLCLFSHLGYVESFTAPVLPPREVRSFIYSLLPDGRLLNDLDRSFMSSVELGTHLFTLNDSDYAYESEDIAFLAVEMKDVGWARSEEAYGIHYLLSKSEYRKSVVLFRHSGAILLSFLCPLEEGKLAIYLSDWMDIDAVDDGQMERYHVASTSLESADECFFGLAFEAMREYYKYPITASTAWYCDVMGGIDRSWSLDQPFYSRAEIVEAVDKAMARYVDFYGDDYVEDRVEAFEGEDDFSLIDIEWELQNDNADDESVEADNEVDEDDEEFLDAALDEIDKIPQEVLADPVKLLDWISNHSSKGERNSVARNASNQVLLASSADHREKGRHTVETLKWDEKMAEQRLVVGQKVLHKELGVGVIDSCNDEIVSVRFEDTRRSFAFPLAFSRGILELIRR